MNNAQVLLILNECQDDLDIVKYIVQSLGFSSTVVPYLSKYAIIKACGTIEIAFKAIITDHCSKRSKRQVKQFLSRKIKDSSSNPSYENICKILKDFDENWLKDFKNNLKSHPDYNVILTSMQSLVDARNDFAHGGNPNLTIADTISYFNYCRTAMIILDQIMC